MAKIKEITKSIAMKCGTLQFSNVDIFVCVKAELDENDDVEKVGRDLDEALLSEFGETKAILDNADVSLYKLPQFSK